MKNLQKFLSSPDRQGAICRRHPPYVGNVADGDLPRRKFGASDVQKRFHLDKLKERKLNAMSKWRLLDRKGMKKNAYIKEVQQKNAFILKIQEKNDLEKNEVIVDDGVLPKLRKPVKKFLILAQMTANAIISAPLFENVVLAIILANSVVMVFERPNQEQPPIFGILDDMFTYLYTAEMFLKIVGLGFVMDEKSYLRDSWNILDFIIVISSYIPKIVEATSAAAAEHLHVHEVGRKAESSRQVELTALRSFRVMRPLRTISSIKGLKLIMASLFAAAPLLKGTLMILMFFFIIFAIAGQ